jgi:hypothetical protein
MAYAFGHAVAPVSDRDGRMARAQEPAIHDDAPVGLTRGETAVLLIEMLLSVGIALVTIGLAAMAALPGRMTVGALLAQVAVLGALVAPPVVVAFLGIRLRPAALALALAQLANLIFFVHAIRALW